MSAVDVHALVTGREGAPREKLSVITAPTLAIAGDEDPATAPAKLEQIVAGIPGATLPTAPQAAHLANAEQPDIITVALIEHLEHP